MRSFVYDTRVIENERQVKLEHQVKGVGKMVRTLVKAFVAFLFFVVLNLLINALAQYTNMFSLSTWRFIEEAMRVLFVDNAFTTSSVIYQDMFSFVLALTFAYVDEFGMFVKVLNNGGDKEKEHTQHNKSEGTTQSTNNYGIVSYRNKVCFLS